MPLTVLDECFSLEAQRTDAGALSVQDPNSPARRHKRFSDTPLETWSVRFDEMNTGEAAALLAIFAGVGYTRPIAWQAPGAGATAAYRFDSFSITANAGNAYRAEAVLVRQLSVSTS